MTDIVKRLRIWWLKKRLRGLYPHATTVPDDMDCGLQMAYVIRPSLGDSARKFNNLMDKLAQIDPDTPEHRLKVY